ncbi:hypothetical protein [Kitasatospora sp. NPDC005856]
MTYANGTDQQPDQPEPTILSRGGGESTIWPQPEPQPQPQPES